MDDRDPDAYRELYRAHYATVHRYLAARAPADQVDDLTAETFLVAWRRFGTVPDHVLPWLLNVATKILANQRRSAERAGALAGRVREVAVLDSPDVEQDVERREHRRALLDALETLGPQDRELMLLHVWEDLPARRIAVVLELSPVVTRARLSRARRRLARALRSRLDAGPAPTVTRPDPTARPAAPPGPPAPDARRGPPVAPTAPHRPGHHGTVPSPSAPTTTRTRT